MIFRNYALYAIVCLVITCLQACNPSDRSAGMVMEPAQIRQYLDSAFNVHMRGQTDSALSVMRLICRQAPTPFLPDLEQIYYSNLASIAFDVGAYAVTIDAIASQISDSSGSMSRQGVTHALRLAHGLKKAGDTSMATVWYRVAEQLSPNHTLRDINSNLAWLYVAQGQYDSALVRVVRADSLHMNESRRDINGLAWSLFIRARSMAGLGRTREAEHFLQKAIETLEQRRENRNNTETSVRLSIYGGIWRDSVHFQRIGSAWRRLKSRLIMLQRSDSATVQSPLSEFEPRITNRSFNFSELFPLPGSDPYVPAPHYLDGTRITSTASDSRGWQWVSTLQGMYIRVGQKLLPVSQAVTAGRPRAAKAIKIMDDIVFLDRYDGSVDTLDLKTLVRPQPQSTATGLRRGVQWSWLSWKGLAATSMVHVPGSDSVVYFYRDRVGYGTISDEPRHTASIHYDDGRPWTYVAQCGYFEDDTTMLIGSNKGVWKLHVPSNVIRPQLAEPTYVNRESILSISAEGGDGLYVVPGYGLPLTYTRSGSSGIDWMHGYRIESMWQLPWSPPKRLSIMSDIHSHYHDIIEEMLPSRTMIRQRIIPYEYENHGTYILADSLITWLYPTSLAICDLRQPSLTFATIPEHMRIRDSTTRIGYTDNGKTVGVLASGGVLVGSLTDHRPESGTSICAVRQLHSGAYTLFADGGEFQLDHENRDVQIVIGRPLSYGSMRVPIRVSLSWSDQIIYTTTSEDIVLRALPPGDHVITVVADDQVQPTIIRLDVRRRTTESWWFWTGVAFVVLSLSYGSVRYVVLLRQHRREALKSAALEERVQIGRDLHDALGADLVRINMLTQRTRDLPEATEIRRVVREASRTLRDIIWSVSEQHTLDAVIAILAERVRSSAEEAGVRPIIKISTEVPPYLLSPQTLRDIALIVTECITNSIKHAKAQTLEMTVECRADGVSLNIVDDGVGFDTELASEGIGLRSMQQRADRSKLEISISSNLGAGTRVHLHIPHQTA